MSEDETVKVRRRRTGKADPPMAGRAVGAAGDGLPLIHMTAVGAAREIVRTGSIDTRRCPVFDRDLVYFFVGRPAYRLKHGDDKSNYISMFPCLFMGRGTTLGAPYHVYPLDTGGLMAGVFGGHPDPHVYLEDYELEPNLASAAGHIAWAFEDLQAYYNGDLRPGLSETLARWDEVGVAFTSLARLASRQSNTKPDLRASTVEVAYSRPVSLKDAVDYAILPAQYLEDQHGPNSKFIERLTELGIAWEVYDWQPHKTPNQYNDEINQLVRRRLFGPKATAE
ncbi:hypothetical protein [Caulobacter endophyticus]|uniref:hypothetical protein n=1 Tax=Caulobacter endophyticus TaxID=2172652 RepID=UPI0024103A5C|nr:hypothetical protein [Caulobacter endophyticus]MDG2531267.1 hypothetical protein [Caulobacter endophyticus]